MSYRPGPTGWSHENSRGNVDVSQDGLFVRYRGSTGFPDERRRMVGAAKGNAPCPRSGIYYFEFTVVNQGNGGLVGIGMMTEQSRLSDMPGWGKTAKDWGYHGDDGNVIFEGTAYRKATSTANRFGTGDTVGCGVNWNVKDGSIFFTKNGLYLGAPVKKIGDQDLYPAVGLLSAGAEIHANFGQQPFKIDIGTYAHDPEAAEKHAKGFHSGLDSIWGHVKEGMAEGLGEGIGEGIAHGLGA
ncbi:hypothetical protein JAAARDRAFT_60943 [Jaapia argillacea MUCL 33604]|uniref:B30.2/SPRY domain-containing protein n=1 Tax=Jaapia argillacea MUCL 33604 TaxID=933084 RepID=A0A067PRA2_9AGAM|nr:hypothetical protein JAAARDRAFT_60943 [Jaapia argillacea MUCL 33604]